MRKALLVLSIVTTILFGTLALSVPGTGRYGDRAVYEQNIEYPIHRDGETYPVLDPQPQRGQEFRKWLSPSVRIRVTGAAGSGTICYYDSGKNIAYVISCGHLWREGTMSAEQGKQRNLTCTVEAFYHNDEKLAQPERFTATVQFYSHVRGEDYSLMTFTPTWHPTYFPIAPASYQYPAKGTHVHSCGCDHATECAHYDVAIRGMSGPDMITDYNSPRPGRSGGGLMDDQYYIGICWGTSDRSGNGYGLFTPLSVIRPAFEREGFGWLLSIPPGSGLSQAREIPIVDRNGPQRVYPKEYIPLPGSR